MAKKETVYAFIDAQNLKMGVKNNMYHDKAETNLFYEGWNLNYKKFRQYLTDKYGVSEAYLFMGEIPGNEWLYNKLRKIGFNVVLRKAIPYSDDGVSKTKGNIDADLVLYAARLKYDQYDKAVIVSGDGDFVLMLEYLEAENKLLKILAPNSRYSSLLNKFGSRVDIIGNKRDELESNGKSVTN